MINEKAFIINAIFDYFHISESTGCRCFTSPVTWCSLKKLCMRIPCIVHHKICLKAYKFEVDVGKLSNMMPLESERHQHTHFCVYS